MMKPETLVCGRTRPMFHHILGRTKKEIISIGGFRNVKQVCQLLHRSQNALIPQLRHQWQAVSL
jgi:hypothetical protein